MAKLYVVGIGPGGREHMTLRAVEVIKKCDVIAGYSFYIELLGDLTDGKEIIKTGMKSEIERCRAAIEKTREGYNTCIVSTGDAGLYGMAGPIYEMADDIEIEVIPGVSAAFCAASEVGAPIMHDFCTISLSDLLTSWEVIEKRLHSAGQGDFVVAIYNPKSSGRIDNIKMAAGILLKYKKEDTPAAIVRNAGRAGEERFITTLGNIDYNLIDMMSVVIIGNSRTYVKNGFMITPRGYNL